MAYSETKAALSTELSSSKIADQKVPVSPDALPDHNDYTLNDAALRIIT